MFKSLFLILPQILRRFLLRLHLTLPRQMVQHYLGLTILRHHLLHASLSWVIRS